MKKRSIRVIGIVGLTLVAFAVTFLLQKEFVQIQKALAQSGPDFVIWQSTFGFTATQKARISLVKPSGGPPTNYSYDCYDQSGLVVFTPTTLMVGDFDSVDIRYEDLDIAAEPGTGRKQVMVRVVGLREGRSVSNVVGALEIINADGTTATYQRFE
jgi:hypothetical protein